jgi:hypothetical protein
MDPTDRLAAGGTGVMIRRPGPVLPGRPARTPPQIRGERPDERVM